MADPLSITASILAVVTAAAQSAKLVHDLIQGLKDAPKILLEALTEVNGLDQVLGSISQTINHHRILGGDGPGSEQHDSTLMDLEAIILDCQATLDEFKEFLERRQLQGMLDRAAFFLKRADLERFQRAIQRNKSTLAIALMHMNYQLTQLSIQSSEQSREAMQRLEQTAITTSDRITAQLQGITIAVSELTLENSAGDTVDNNRVLSILEKEQARLAKCSAFCLRVLERASKATGHSALVIEAVDNGWQTIGNIGDVKNPTPMAVDHLIARDQSLQMFGNMSDKAVELMFQAKVEASRGQPSTGR